MKTCSECEVRGGMPPSAANQIGGSRESAAHGTDEEAGQ